MPQLKNIIILRSFAIVVVVLYHCYCPWMYAWNWFECPCQKIYSLILEVMLVGRMPLFVFVSGYLFAHLIIDRGKYKSFVGFLNNKFKRLMIPCFVFTGIMCLLLNENYIDAVICGGYHLWFLKMLFWCFITGWLLNKYATFLGTRLLAFVISILMMSFKGISILGIGQFYKYFAFFYGGYLFYSYLPNLKILFQRKYLLILIAAYSVIMAFVLWQYVCAYTPDIIHSDKLVVIARYLLRPLTILIAFMLVNLYLHKKNEISSIFSKINNISYGIYLFHMLLLQIMHKYFFNEIKDLANCHYIIAPLILFIIIIILSIAICQFLKQFKWSKWIIG